MLTDDISGKVECAFGAEEKQKADTMKIVDKWIVLKRAVKCVHKTYFFPVASKMTFSPLLMIKPPRV